jgi:NADH-quinone oxidoreductase subunit F
LPDLRLLAAEPSDAERGAIDAVLGVEGPSSSRVARSDRMGRHLLLPALRAAQRRVGWVSEGALAYATRRLEVAPADAYGVASFYALLALDERPADVTHMCTDLACALKGAAVPPGAVASPCLGLCELAPAALRTACAFSVASVPESIPSRSTPTVQAVGTRR